MLLEINEKSLIEDLSLNIINEEDNMERLTEGVSDCIMKNLLKDKDFTKKLHKKIIETILKDIDYYFEEELENYVKQLYKKEFNKIKKEDKDKILKKILLKMGVKNE